MNNGKYAKKKTDGKKMAGGGKLLSLASAFVLLCCLCACGAKTSENGGAVTATLAPLGTDEAGETDLSGKNISPTGESVRPSGDSVLEKADTSRNTAQAAAGGQTVVFNLAAGENGKAPVVTLNSGYEMPIVGLGTYSLLDDVCVDSVAAALQRGFRMIDTAYMYGNEKEVGEGIRKSGVPREDVFVITKLYPNQYGDAAAAIDMALEKLGLDYIDMMLLHHPGNNDVAAYKAMEQAVADGKIRSLGLSNWYIEEMEAFLPQVDIPPALVQNEIHPYYQESEVIDYMHQKGIVMQAWYPLGGRGHQSELLSDPVIEKIAQAHGKSAAQVILRWDLQNGVVVIPGSSNPDHMTENISLFDFSLTEEEMAEMSKLNRNEKHDWY